MPKSKHSVFPAKQLDCGAQVHHQRSSVAAERGEPQLLARCDYAQKQAARMLNPHLVLVYPPYANATSPPMGVCALKGHVKKQLPEWAVSVLDLNLAAHRDLIDSLTNQALPAAPNRREVLVQQILLSRAAEVFRGEHPADFDRTDRYFAYTQLWVQVVSAQAQSARGLEQQFRQDKPVPPIFSMWADKILQKQPGVVGLSVCYSDQLWISLCLARTLKHLAKVPIILGGTAFNSLDPSILSACLSVADFVVSGEGEQPLVELLSQKLDPKAIAGVSSLQNGRSFTEPFEVCRDLDSLGAPDFSDLNLNDYYCPEPVLPVLSSRGCYWRRCAFCAHYRSAGLTYRQRAVDHVIEELKQHVSQGVTHFALIDEMISPARFGQLANAIIESGLKINYYGLAKPTKQFDKPLLQKMMQSGCRYLLWGLESGCQRLLDLMDKGTLIADIGVVLDTAHEVGIRNHVYALFGFPTETQSEFLETLHFLDQHKQSITMVHRGIFQLEKDSPVFENPVKYSITKVAPSANPTLATFECSAGMTAQEVRELFSREVMRIRSYGTPYPEFGDYVFRDHALLRYCRTLISES